MNYKLRKLAIALKDLGHEEEAEEAEELFKTLNDKADYLDDIIKFAEEESFKTIGNPEEKIKELFGRNLQIFTHATQALNKNNFQGYLAQGHRIFGNNLGHTFAIVDSFESMIEKFLPPYNQLAQYGSNVIILGINTKLGTMDTAGIVDPRFDPSDALTYPQGMYHGDIFHPTPVRWAGIFKGEEYEDKWYGTKNLIDSKFVFGLWEFENKVLHLNPNFEPNEPTSSGAEYIRNYQIAREKMEDPEFIEKAKQIRESEFAKIEPVSSPIISSEEETEDDDDVF